MTNDLNLHVEAIRALFKKRFSGECTNSDGLKSTDILKGKNDVDKNFDWNVCVNDLDEFNEDVEVYIKKNKNSEEDIIKLVDEFKKSNLEIDKKIGEEIDNLYQGSYIP